jgi:hypothetical protein
LRRASTDARNASVQTKLAARQRRQFAAQRVGVDHLVELEGNPGHGPPVDAFGAVYSAICRRAIRGA